MITLVSRNEEKVICNIETNQSMTIEEMLELAGAERITEDHPEYDANECGDYWLNGEEIFVEDLEQITRDQQEKIYMDFDTGVVFTLYELKREWFGDGSQTFDEWLEKMLLSGRERTGGLIEIAQ